MTPETLIERPAPGSTRTPRESHPAAPPPRADLTGAPGESVSLLDLVAVLLRQKLLIAACVALVAIPPVVLTLVRPRTFSATTAFMPQSRSQNNVSSLASTLGLTLPTADATQSPQFYADLATSREILGKVAADSFAAGGRTRRPLAAYFDVENPSPALRRDAVIKALRRSVDVSVAQKTGVVNLSVKTEDPALSRDVARRIVELLHEFNLEGRRSRATAERQFTERRLAQATAELRAAENRFEAFLLQNRNWTNSPTLRFQEERLSRAVSNQAQVQASLAQAYEQARLEEVRDTPVITVIEEAEVPPLPDRRGLVTKLLLGACGGLTLGVIVALLRHRLAAALAERRMHREELGVAV